MSATSADFFYDYFDEDAVSFAEEEGMLIVSRAHVDFDENMGDISVFEFAFMFNDRDEAIVLETELREDIDGTEAFTSPCEETRLSWLLDQIRRLSDECSGEEQSTLATWGGAVNFVMDSARGTVPF